MEQQAEARRVVQAALTERGYAVLATTAEGQPHANLMAFAARDDGRELVFAMYRGTRKFRNIAANARVAVVIDHEQSQWLRAPRHIALTALGAAYELEGEARTAALRDYLGCHPDLQALLADPACALVGVAVEGYQVASGIDEVRWCPAADLDAN